LVKRWIGKGCVQSVIEGKGKKAREKPLERREEKNGWARDLLYHHPERKR